jgi:N-acyl amino acid synthase of PEP-CTERM/exosortase system
VFLSSLTELAMSQGYRRFFKVVPATTDALRAENYRIRHQVYCRELGFEPVRPDGLESDAFDAQSVHCLVQSVSTGEYVGCARLVLAKPDCLRKYHAIKRLRPHTSMKKPSNTQGSFRASLHKSFNTRPTI